MFEKSHPASRRRTAQGPRTERAAREARRRPLSPPWALPPALAWLPAFALLAASAPPAAAWTEGLVLTADFLGPGMAASFSREAPWGVTPDREPLGTDPVARWRDGLVYVVNRSGDSNLQVLDPAAGYQTVRQFSLGAGRNPQDIAFGPDGRAWVSCYDTAELLEVDAEAGSVVAAYSTAGFADADGLPETGWMQAVGGRLFVTAQLLDRNGWYAPTGPGRLLVFDMAARAWVDADPAAPGVNGIVLAGANPYPQLELSADRQRLYVPCVGWYGAADGGVDAVDVAGLRSLGFAITESVLGGDVLDVVVVGSELAFASVSDASFVTSLRRWNPRTGELTGVLRTAAGYAYVDLAWDGGDWLYVCDRTTGAAGLRVFAAATGVEQTVAPLATGLPPAWLALPRQPHLVAAPAAGAPAALVLAAPFPNPANPGCEIRLRGPALQAVPVAIHDLRGRRLRSATVVTDAAGEGRWRCDGRDDRGRSLPSGLYRVTAGAGPAAVSRPLAVVR